MIDFPRTAEIVGFPGYRVDTKGRVWSCWKRQGLGGRCGIIRVLSNSWFCRKLSLRTDGYLGVSLCREDQQVNVPVHLLVLRCFVGPKPSRSQARHLNGDRRDNRLANLVWGTPSENCRDRSFHGRTKRGVFNPKTKLNDALAQEIRRLHAAGSSSRLLGKQFGVNKSTILRIVHNQIWNDFPVDAPQDVKVYRAELLEDGMPGESVLPIPPGEGCDNYPA
jgi:hypothetical protein